MDDEVLVNEATEIFPKIGKLFYAGMMHQLQNLGCSLGQMKVMGHLYTYGQGTISEVATSVGVSLPTASELSNNWTKRAGSSGRRIPPIGGKLLSSSRPKRGPTPKNCTRSGVTRCEPH